MGILFVGVVLVVSPITSTKACQMENYC